MERSADGAWSVGGYPVVPPPWWVDRLNVARLQAGQRTLGRWDPLTMQIWAMVSAPPPTQSLVHVTGC
jgi:hypothetical protein